MFVDRKCDDDRSRSIEIDVETSELYGGEAIAIHIHIYLSPIHICSFKVLINIDHIILRQDCRPSTIDGRLNVRLPMSYSKCM